MAEVIEKIEEFEGRGKERWSTESGFDITTTEQTITLAIDDFQSCCESWGYFLSEDDASKFVGAELRGVKIVDENRTSRVFQADWKAPYSEDDIHLDEGAALFVDIETDRGVLQFVAYNAHNGYYGHEARISSKQLKHEVGL